MIKIKRGNPLPKINVGGGGAYSEPWGVRAVPLKKNEQKWWDSYKKIKVAPTLNFGIGLPLLLKLYYLPGKKSAFLVYL